MASLRKAKVITLSISGRKRNNIYRAGEIVTDKELNNFDSLLKDGSIEILSKNDLAEEAKVAEEAKGNKKRK